MERQNTSIIISGWQGDSLTLPPLYDELALRGRGTSSCERPLCSCARDAYRESSPAQWQKRPTVGGLSPAVHPFNSADSYLLPTCHCPNHDRVMSGTMKAGYINQCSLLTDTASAKAYKWSSSQFLWNHSVKNKVGTRGIN